MNHRRIFSLGAIALSGSLALGALALGPAGKVEAAAPATESASLATYEVDLAHAYVLFRIKHLGVGWNYGRFNSLAATLAYDAEKPGNSSVEFSADTQSVDTGNGKRDTHLRSPDFFNAKQFPKLSFKSTRIKRVDAETLEVTGEFSLHGKSKEITFPVEITGQGKDPWDNLRAGFEARFTLLRSDFDITFMDKLLSDEVKVTVAFEAIAK
ncbi:MAG TPA: YceI family protein [Planctomycetota bacterium]